MDAESGKVQQVAWCQVDADKCDDALGSGRASCSLCRKLEGVSGDDVRHLSPREPLLVLSAQEKALHFLRNGGDVGGLEGVPLAFGQSPDMGEEEKVHEKKVPEPPQNWRVDGLGVQDVCREVLEEALSNGPLTEECLATEKANGGR